MPNPVDPTERIVRNLLIAQRAGNSIGAEATPLLNELFDQIADDLRAIDPTTPSAARWRDFRTEEVLAEVRRRVPEAIADWEREVRSGLAQVGRQQGEFAERLLVASLGDAGSRVTRTLVTQQRIRSILNSRPFDGATLKEWAGSMEASTVRRISRQVKLGMAQEETLDDIIRRVRGRQAGYIRQDPRTGAFVAKGTRGANVRPRFVGGVWQATTRDAEAVVRTAVNHVQNQAHMETYRANERLLRGYTFSATLDDRTTLICGSLDRQFWPKDDPDIQTPPLHFGCRSALVPEPDYEGVGLDPPPEGERAARDVAGVDADDRARKVSARRRTGDLGAQARVSSGTSYERWLKDQPNAVQNEILGPGRARVFRDGRMGLRDMVRSDHSIVPLTELLEGAP